MDAAKIKKILLRAALAYWLFALLVFVIAHNEFKFEPVESKDLAPRMTVGELVDGAELVQRLRVPCDRVDLIKVRAATYARKNSGSLRLQIVDGGSPIAQADADVGQAVDGEYIDFALSKPVEGLSGKDVLLKFSAQGCAPGNAITFFAGNSVATARQDVAKNLSESQLYEFVGKKGTGMLCVKVAGVNFLNFHKYYWPIIAGVFVLAVAYALRSYFAMKHGGYNFLSAIFVMLTQYQFLIKQLVSRDFKVKYKRSVLGVLWSFLNPLLMMLVQYAVFSSLFKSSIPNFPVYLLVGTVFFSFFSEAVSMGMSSIIGNASLIKKVYVPKYIYPVSRVLFSLVNFALAFAPLFLVMLATGTGIGPSIFLLLYDIICFLGFITGMVLVLATAATFFQDVQFLWRVATTLWMYATPIFYPETIIPERFLPFYHLNPLYQYITFARTCIIGGVSPGPASYLGCLLPAMILLCIGAHVFKKQQDKFIMYI